MPILVYMRYLFFLLIICSACGVSKKDYTRNTARSGDRHRIVDPNANESERLRIIITHAKNMIGKNYRYGGCGPESFDCSGFTQYVYKKSGIPLPRRSEDQARSGYALSVEDIKKGDLVVFSIGKKVSHVGVCVGSSSDELWVVHATSSRGVIMENIMESVYWSRRVQGGRRVLH